MTVNTIAKAFRTAILNSTSISSFCVTNFGRAHKVFYGSDDERSPSEADCPVFEVKAKTRDENRETGEQSYGVTIHFTIKQPEPTVVGNSTEFTGDDLLETGLDLAVTALFGVSSNLIFDSVSVEIGTVSEFPLKMAEMNVSVKLPVVIGAQIGL